MKEIGSFRSVTVTAAPKGVSAWIQSAKELTANGCAGGGAGRTKTALCLTGAPIALTDNMEFTFAFTGGTLDLDEPHLKVNFVDASKNKVGDLFRRRSWQPRSPSRRPRRPYRRQRQPLLRRQRPRRQP